MEQSPDTRAGKLVRRRVGIVYKADLPIAQNLTHDLLRACRALDAQAWACSTEEPDEACGVLPATDMLISVGGDGTILRVARLSAPWAVPILGINLGRLGFMAELDPNEALGRLPEFLAGAGREEVRSMMQAELLLVHPRERPPQETLYALNDVVVSRASPARVVRVKASVDGAVVTTYKSDGVIVATATGSTGYAMAAGGPILDPEATDMVLIAITPHLSMPNALVLPASATIVLEVQGDQEVVCTVDGHVEVPLETGDQVRLTRSPYQARFLRSQPTTHFYATLTERLRQQP